MAESEVKKRRVAAKGWVTRASKRLCDLLDQHATISCNPSELADAIDIFDERWTLFKDTQTAFEQFMNEEDLDSLIIETDKFMIEQRKHRVRASTLLSQLQQPAVKDSDSVSTNSQFPGEKQATLPKIELPTFSGSVMEWDSFNDQFNALIHDSDLPTVSKFVYLQSVLKGEAKSVIQGLSLTADHYNVARDLLQQRYGRREKQIFAHIDELISIQFPQGSKGKVSSLWSFQDKLLTHVRCLEKLGITGTQYGVVLTPVVLSRLPADLRMEWARESEGKESDLDFLLQFLKREIDSRERSQTFVSNRTESCSGRTSDSGVKVHSSTATALYAVTETVVSCSLCGKRHATHKCWDWQKLSIDERVLKMKDCGLCFCCMSKNHIAKNCKQKCSKCHGKHHSLLCKRVDKNLKVQERQDKTPSGSSNQSRNVLQNETETEIKEPQGTDVAFTVASKSHITVVMQIAKIPVLSNKGVTYATVLFDTGSNRTYVSSDFVKRAQPELIGLEPVSYVTFGSNDSECRKMRNLFSLRLKHADTSDYKSISAIEIPVICAPIFCPSVSKHDLTHFNNLNFANNYEESSKVTIDILIGMDLYWSLVKSTVVGPSGLVALETLFGWILSGTSTLSPSADGDEDSVSLLCFNDLSDDCLHRFWDLESVGVYENQNASLDPVLAEFEKTVTFSGGRYEVSLPWKPNKKLELQNNEALARKRLQGLSKKLSKNCQLEKGYHSYFEELKTKGMIEEVPKEDIDCQHPVFYLPHRPIVKESSLSTKIRPVFDASASGSNFVSLNQCLYAGPNLLTDLVEILIRFRRWPIAVTADLQKAFLQVGVAKKDRDVHRFLLNVQGNIRVMRFTRLPFGNCSSPFLLNATIAHHLNRVEYSPVVEELKDNLYVDDFLFGGDTNQAVCEMIRGSSDVMQKAGFTFGKWCSNSSVVGEMLDIEFNDKNLNTETSVKVLGVKWITSEDSFGIDVMMLPAGLVVTKRIILSFIAKLFDPLGFLTPFVMTIKCVFQDIWKLGISWDEEVPTDFKSRFLAWYEGLSLLKDWRIPRSYTGLPWKEIEFVHLHGFGDASQKGYGACVYMVCQYKSGPRFSVLVISRARVAPLKTISLPRLELLGALLCARLVSYVGQVLRLTDKVQVNCWTDSSVTLAWIKGDPGRWKAFVANRVVQISEITSPAAWRFVPGSENPADLVTRGLLAHELMSSALWLNGPSFLMSESGAFSQTIEQKDEEVELPVAECRTVPKVALATHAIDDPLCIDVERWSSFNKALRVIAWIWRFVDNASLSRENKTGDLTFDELSKSKLKLFALIQEKVYSSELKCLRSGQSIHKNSGLFKLSPFIGPDGLLRVGGRLDFSQMSFEEKHPIILPKGHVSLLVVRFYHKMLKHAGVSALVAAVRRQYWVIGLRVLAKRVKRECIACQRQDALACAQPMAPLPSERVTRSPPFSVTGIDHFGPLYCSDCPKKKFYVLLFTCGVVRAVHLELVDSLNTSDTLLAMRRFIARRGIPSVVYSDNSQTFKSLKSRMLSIYGPLCPKHKFIVPRSPWWGGWWERLVKSVKTSSRKTLGCKFITRTELETVLHEIEQCINSRPLTFVSDEIDAGEPLTPSHFLMEKPSGGGVVELGDHTISAATLRKKNALREEMLERFWHVWQFEYIKELPKSIGCKTKNALSVGAVVIVKDQGLPKLKWPLAIVTKLFPGKDGLVRSVELKTSRGTICRSVQLLHDLEIVGSGHEERGEFSEECLDSGSNDNVPVTNKMDSEPCVDVPVNIQKVSRYGRQRKTPSRLDL